jgi:hypothetical protein
MARYLLGSQCVVDIVKRVNMPPQRWVEEADARGIDGRDVYISAMTPTILRRAARTDPGLALLQSNLDLFTDRYLQRGQIAAITKRIADKWDDLVDLQLNYLNRKGAAVPYSSREKLVLATAIEGLDGRPFILVERHQPAHDTLRPYGLELEDPYQVYT